MTETTLITGGAGFLGSHLCEKLLSKGNEVICVDNFGSGRRTNISDLMDSERFRVLNKDIRHEVALPPVDEIYHLASRASPADFTDFPVDIALTNTRGTRNLLDHAVATGARMVYASTSEVYGDPEVVPQPESYTGNVNIRGPRGCYDESKRFGETLTVAYEKEYNVDVRTARIFNTYGPRMRPDDGRVIPTFVTQALNGDDLTVYGDGTQTRSFCYVDDLIDGLSKLMMQDQISGEVVNLGQENEMSINSLAELVLDTCESESGVTHEPLPEDDPEQRRPDTQRVKELLSWEAQIHIENGLSRTVDWYRRELEQPE
ncbi:UDP-glucuronic acid decarboxylase family protein [Haloarcula sp. GH36]|uniref:UDP-glucuronic acid decarboxylase family protein n=1 Tax=Haloarcula montana TaxID=3111776 RepID=UPI002D799BDD|nr:UDP-glucuronic acid decarboxylase family protein [Haloarcula sp. GH36]